MALDLNNMERLAVTDYLTGLMNRRGLYEYYESIGQDSVHAMFIDVDNFKRVNDIYGHSIGDALLVQIAQLIKESSDGFVSRIGGDEFVVLCSTKLSEKDMEAAATVILQGMDTLDFRRDIMSNVSLSVGLVYNQSTSVSLDSILAKCDSAMYQAKFNGKNCYTVYQENDMSIEMSKNIESEMESALEEGQFIVYFQPKVNILTSSLYGAEALSRWIHPVDGVRRPDLYIPVFEKNGFIAKLDMYVFEKTCEIKRSFKGKSFEHIPISVNLSRLHLYNKKLPDKLIEIANRYEIPPNELELEITESVFIRDTKELIDMVDLLESKGFLVSIDDFGSGYSALNLLKDIPVTTIKLDKDFLKLSSNSVRGKKVIRNVVAMCKDLKLDVVCEGIETKEQADFVSTCGCQIAQGFLYSKPIPLSDFEAYASEHYIGNRECFTFRLNGTLVDESKTWEGELDGTGFSYVDGIFSDSKSLHFPGGQMQKNTLSLPTNILMNDSFTISMWIRPSHNNSWSSALYIKYESGFMSIIPLSMDGLSATRFRDSKEINGWYDLFGCVLRENEWVHYSITYNAKTERAVAFINGEVVSTLEDVPTNRFVKNIILGGDVFQRSFEGEICELTIYNETKDYDFIAELHDRYRRAEGFIGFPVDMLENE